MKNQVYAGIDACRGGWLMVYTLENTLRWKADRSLANLAEPFDLQLRILIDMPIGLADEKIVRVRSRSCDQEARKLLDKQRSSVFNPPCLEALFATTYEEACRINQQVTGIKISKQSWNIAPKIRELNAFLHHNPSWRNRMLEAHPELAFRYLNNEIPLDFSKKTSEGAKERLSILAKAHSAAESCYDNMLKAPVLKNGFAQRDDMLDALALAVHNLLRADKLQNIAPESPVDALGNKMELWL
jgi:predicted RNase H-like nuclease